LFIMVILAAFIVPILVSLANGSFITEKIRTYDSLTDIRGSSTIVEVIENYDISKEHIYLTFGLPGTISVETKIKDLAELTGIPEEEEILSPKTMRMLVEIYPQKVSEIIPVMQIEVDEFDEILQENGISQSDSVRTFISFSKPGILVYILTGKNPQDYLSKANNNNIIGDNEEEIAELNQSVESDVKGKTTLAEIRNMIDDYSAFIESFPVFKDESETISLKDLKEKYEIEISDVKIYVNEHLK